VGGQQISKVLNTLKGRAPQGSGFWIMSSTDANTEVGDGDFIEALTSVMKLDHPLFEATTDFLSISATTSASLVTEFPETNEPDEPDL
jgi:hypothetical protein